MLHQKHISQGIKTKICSKCNEEKPLSLEYFCKNKSRKSGFDCWCKQCKAIYRASNKTKLNEYFKIYRNKNALKRRKQSVKYYYDHHDERLKYGEKYRKNNVSIIQNRNGKYREKNIDRIRLLNRLYVKKNRKKISIKSKIYRKNNMDIIRSRKHQYYIDNREKINAHHKERLKTNINYRIAANLRSRLWCALRSQNVKKTNHTMYLVGCSQEFLKKYLESNFIRGMSWDNYGRNGWNIDHIIPCAAFNLSNIKKQKKCFNYKNLRPMWEKDNLRKNSFYNGKMIKSMGNITSKAY